jgi:hypothetical protein
LESHEGCPYDYIAFARAGSPGYESTAPGFRRSGTPARLLLQFLIVSINLTLVDSHEGCPYDYIAFDFLD